MINHAAGKSSSGWFAGKTVLITGATSGIGRAMVKQLATWGSHLLLCGRDEKAMQALEDEIKKDGGKVLAVYLSDLTDEARVKNLSERIAAEHHVDVLINNAGFGDMNDFALMLEEKVTAMMAVNMQAMAIFCRRFFPEMQKRSGTGILNVGSVASFFPTPHSALYGATKHFVLGLTDALHEEARGSGVHVTGLYPGKTLTRFIERATDGKVAQWDKAATPEDVALAGLKGLSENRVRVIPGRDNQMKVLVSRLLPIELLLKKTGENTPH